MFYQEAISWHAIEIILELTCFNYKMLPFMIVLPALRRRWLHVNKSTVYLGAIKRLIYYYPTHFLISIIYL